MINDYSLSKMFYEDIYKAFTFYVEHPRKVFIYKLFMSNTEKKYEFDLTLKKAVFKNDGKVKIVLKIYRNLHICIKKKMDEVKERRIEVETHQGKVHFANNAYEKKLQYWKRVALESVSTENGARELIQLAQRE